MVLEKWWEEDGAEGKELGEPRCIVSSLATTLSDAGGKVLDGKGRLLAGSTSDAGVVFPAGWEARHCSATNLPMGRICASALAGS